MEVLRWVVRFVTHNASLKLLALLGAIFLWAIVPGTPDGTETLSSISVRVQVGDTDWLVAGEPEPGQVTIRVSGPTREIIRLAREGTSIRVPLDEVTSADTVIGLRRDWVVLSGSPGVVVEEIVPTSVRVRLEQAAEEAFPILVRTRGNLPEDLALAFPLGTTPGVVRVSGPERIVGELDAIPTLPVDLSSVSASGRVEVALDTTGLGDALITPQTVSVGIRVTPVAERRLLGRGVEVEGSPGFEPILEPAEVDVLLRGAPGRLDAAGYEAIRVVVDARLMTGMGAGEARTVPVAVLGVPELIRAVPLTDSIQVARPLGGRNPFR
ncbi:MAG TPA: CdaR family protein [Longimicrobiales bacterium]|nr:CdaR family protein [Longimicrobiales bacterium]